MVSTVYAGTWRRNLKLILEPNRRFVYSGPALRTAVVLIAIEFRRAHVVYSCRNRNVYLEMDVWQRLFFLLGPQECMCHTDRFWSFWRCRLRYHVMHPAAADYVGRCSTRLDGIYKARSQRCTSVVYLHHSREMGRSRIGKVPD